MNTLEASVARRKTTLEINPPRRYLTFSLRTLFILLTLFAVWIGMVVRRATEQREAVEAIEALEAKVYYDCQIDYMPYHVICRPWLDKTPPDLPEPRWLRSMVGDDFLHNAELVIFTNILPTMLESEVQRSIPHLKRLRRLQIVRVPDEVGTISSATLAELKAALPNCTIEFGY